MKYALLLALPLLFSASCAAPHAHHRGQKVVVKPVKKPAYPAKLRLKGGVWVRL
jgi:hypothetical protein